MWRIVSRANVRSSQLATTPVTRVPVAPLTQPVPMSHSTPTPKTTTNTPVVAMMVSPAKMVTPTALAAPAATLMNAAVKMGATIAARTPFAPTYRARSIVNVCQVIPVTHGPVVSMSMSAPTGSITAGLTRIAPIPRAALIVPAKMVLRVIQWWAV